MNEAKEERRKWTAQIKSAIECDGWGQIVEAQETYASLSRAFLKWEKNAGISPVDRSLLSQLAQSLQLRSAAISDGPHAGISLSEVSSLEKVVAQVLFSGKEESFPIDLARYSVQKQVLASASVAQVVPASQPVDADEVRRGRNATAPEAEAMNSRGGSLAPLPPPFPSGGTLVVITIEKIGLKNAAQYLRPFLTVTWMSGTRLLEQQQDTPVATQQREQFVVFNVDVFQQSRLEDLMREQNACIFFEFKHYKPKKDKISTKAWSYVPVSALKQGNLVLEIYEKPTDHKLKKTTLLSVKPLYLELVVSMRPH